MDAVAPLTPVEFAALMDALGPFEPAPMVAVGVSGGPDSMALVLLADAWARARGGAVVALTVDHRLRRDSTAEADTVAQSMIARGIRHVILPWLGDKPVSGIQDAARHARHTLLGNACAHAGILHLLLAHHADDQAETVWQRRVRGSGAAGLAGMAAISERPWGRVLRPLLGRTKAQLRATCHCAGLAVIDDPSNGNVVFARARLRAAAQADASVAAVLASLPAQAAREAEDRASLDYAVAALMARTCRLHPEGWGELMPDSIVGAPRAVACALLTALLRAVGGGGYPAAPQSVARLLDLMEGGGKGATLGGCVLRPARGGRWLLAREPGRLHAEVMVRAGNPILWDRRFVVLPVRNGTVSALGADADTKKSADESGLPAVVLRGLPALWRDGQVIARPTFLPSGTLQTWFQPVNFAAGPVFRVVGSV
jgi:tRNA(Ile)-lysidine synthase